MKELKPCPFCGGEPKLRVYNTYIASFTRADKYYVECSKQSDHSKQDNPIGFLAKEEAIEAWNRRAEQWILRENLKRSFWNYLKKQTDNRKNRKPIYKNCDKDYLLPKRSVLKLMDI